MFIQLWHFEIKLHSQPMAYVISCIGSRQLVGMYIKCRHVFWSLFFVQRHQFSSFWQHDKIWRDCVQRMTLFWRRSKHRSIFALPQHSESAWKLSYAASSWTSEYEKALCLVSRLGAAEGPIQAATVYPSLGHLQHMDERCHAKRWLRVC